MESKKKNEKKGKKGIKIVLLLLCILIGAAAAGYFLCPAGIIRLTAQKNSGVGVAEYTFEYYATAKADGYSLWVEKYNMSGEGRKYCSYVDVFSGSEGMTGSFSIKLENLEPETDIESSEGSEGSKINAESGETTQVNSEGGEINLSDSVSGQNVTNSNRLWLSVNDNEAAQKAASVILDETVCKETGFSTIKFDSFIPILTDGKVIALITLDENGAKTLSAEEFERLEKSGSNELDEYLSANRETYIVRLYTKATSAKMLEEKSSKQVKNKVRTLSAKLEAGEVSGTNTSQDLDDTANSSDNNSSAESGNSGSIYGNLSDEDMSSLMSLFASSMQEAEPITDLALPKSESELSLELAKQALSLCGGGTKAAQTSLLVNSGFEVLVQYGYDKLDTDVSHTCAFMISKKQVDFYGIQKTLLLVTIRGTNKGEWFSNFNYVESMRDEAEFAENFLEAAQVVNINLVPIIANNPDALILVCGHSRGAAAANLLGMTLDDMYGKEGIYVYTFATPNTYRGIEKNSGYENVFNFINPADVVTEVPLKAQGFHHIGTDIVLPCEKETTDRIATAMEILYNTAPSIYEYYTVRHSLTAAGLDPENGYTAYEIMQALASSMTGVRSVVNNEMNLEDIYAIMDASPTGEESDFAPLIAQLSKIIGRNGEYGMSIFIQHMPATYNALIEAYSQILESMTGGIDLSQFGGEVPEGIDLSQYMNGMPEGADMSQYTEEINAGNPNNLDNNVNMYIDVPGNHD